MQSFSRSKCDARPRRRREGLFSGCDWFADFGGLRRSISASERKPYPRLVQPQRLRDHSISTVLVPQIRIRPTNRKGPDSQIFLSTIFLFQRSERLTERWKIEIWGSI